MSFVNRGGTPMVHQWGFVNSRWDPNGAPMGFGEFDGGTPMVHPCVFCEFAEGPQRFTLGVLSIGGGTPMVALEVL